MTAQFRLLHTVVLSRRDRTLNVRVAKAAEFRHDDQWSFQVTTSTVL